jgi:hypothetical protein
MFLQVLQGKVSDAEAFNASIDTWVAELGPGADGWLGTTAGMHGDGSFIALVRFESAEAAQHNSERPEQGEWWSKTAATLDGDASFDNFDDVTLMRDGGSDDAGFVQVMVGRVADVEKERAMTAQFTRLPAEFRPEIIGGVAGLHEDGTFVQAVYFTSEAAAREAEQQEPPEEMKDMMEEGMANSVEMTFIDLTQPMFQSPS